MITSPRNARVAAALRLLRRAARDEERRFLCEGAQSVREALDAGALETLFVADPADAIAVEAGARGIEVVHVSRSVMERLTATVTPQGLVGIAPFVDRSIEEVGDAPRCIALLHAVRDPGNAGTVLRSADAAGADAVVFSETSVDPYNPKAVRASAGSLFHLPVVRGAETSAAIASLRSRGLRIYAMAADGALSLDDADLAAPLCFLFGNEAWGLPDEVAGLADATVRVPIAGRAESLNLAAAATVCLFEWARRLRASRG